MAFQRVQHGGDIAASFDAALQQLLLGRRHHAVVFFKCRTGRCCLLAPLVIYNPGSLAESNRLRFAIQVRTATSAVTLWQQIFVRDSSVEPRLEADKGARYGTVAKVLSKIKNNGIVDIALVTEEVQ